MKYNYKQDRSDYLTPNRIIDYALNEVNLHFKKCNKIEMFGCDVCCSEKNIKAMAHFIEGTTDGLTAEWFNLNWCNPPFKDCKKWVKKAFEEQRNGKTTVLLIPARTETDYFQNFILLPAVQKKTTITFLRKGLKFINAETHEEMGVFKNALCLVYMWGL